LLIALDKMLRSQRRYQGDLSASINDAIQQLDMSVKAIFSRIEGWDWYLF
jgi:hypothetical protein